MGNQLVAQYTTVQENSLIPSSNYIYNTYRKCQRLLVAKHKRFTNNCLSLTCRVLERTKATFLINFPELLTNKMATQNCQGF